MPSGSLTGWSPYGVPWSSDTASAGGNHSAFRRSGGRHEAPDRAMVGDDGPLPCGPPVTARRCWRGEAIDTAEATIRAPAPNDHARARRRDGDRAHPHDD